jgi:hypothetical protein
MPINATPIAGLSDHIDDVRSHTGRGFDGPVVTDGSLHRGPFSIGAPQDAHHVHVARKVLHHYDKNESWGSGG